MMWIWKLLGIIAKKDISNYHKKEGATLLFYKKQEKIVDRLENLIYNIIIKKTGTGEL